MATVVYIARYQHINFSIEYHNALLQLYKTYDEVIHVACSSRTKGSMLTPLDFTTRKLFILSIFPTAKVVELIDEREDAAWAKALETLLANLKVPTTAVIYCDTEYFTKYRGDLYTPFLFDIEPMADLKNIGKILPNPTADFRLGVAYAYQNTYAKVWPAVDVAIFNKNGNILLGYRTKEKKWRLPGGFADPTDINFEDSARRELEEECGIFEVTNWKYETSFKVDDWRYAQDRDKLFTLLFSAHHVSGTPQAGDDLDDVSWFSWDEVDGLLAQQKIIYEHIPLIAHLGKREK